MIGSAVRWFLAILITLSAAVWQRSSGPTYPVSGSVTLGGQEIGFELTRTHGGDGDQPVRIRVADEAVAGVMRWRRFPTQEPWHETPLQRDGEWLTAALPHQPPAGKLEYQVRLQGGSQSAVLPERPAVTRFKGDVPAFVLAPHILAMFLGMLWSNRAGLESLAAGRDLRALAWTAFSLIAAGGFLLGPAVQKYAFDAWWTGVPFGWDLTDNKTLFAGAAWALALWRLQGGRSARLAVAMAALVTLVIFVIPHSVWGSQIDWEQTPSPS